MSIIHILTNMKYIQQQWAITPYDVNQEEKWKAVIDDTKTSLLKKGSIIEKLL